MENVQHLINEIKTNLTQKSSSRKDEVRVMKAMLNDTTYKVGVYDKSGKCGEYCPAESAKQIVSSVLQHSAGISNTEADALAKGYEFSAQDAENMVGILVVSLLWAVVRRATSLWSSKKWKQLLVRIRKLLVLIPMARRFMDVALVRLVHMKVLK